MAKTSLSRFVTMALLWLPVTFVVWYVAAPALLWPVRMLAAGIASGAFGDLVRGVTADGATLTSRAAAAEQASLLLHFRDGALKVVPGDAPSAPSRSRPAPKDPPPEQGKLL